MDGIIKSSKTRHGLDAHDSLRAAGRLVDVEPCVDHGLDDGVSKIVIVVDDQQAAMANATPTQDPSPLTSIFSKLRSWASAVIRRGPALASPC